MTDPSRWSSLNESEREVLRAALATRDAKAQWIANRSQGNAMAWSQADSEVTRAVYGLNSDDPPPTPIEMPDGWVATFPTVFENDEESLALFAWPERSDHRISVHIGHKHAEVPEAALAIALRSAGWRVEGPR